MKTLLLAILTFTSISTYAVEIPKLYGEKEYILATSRTKIEKVASLYDANAVIEICGDRSGLLVRDSYLLCLYKDETVIQFKVQAQSNFGKTSNDFSLTKITIHNP